MLPKISIDTNNLDPVSDVPSDIEMSPMRRSANPVFATGAGEKQSHLDVPAVGVRGRYNSSEGSSAGWEASTAHDLDKGKLDVRDHVRDVLHESDDNESSGSFAFTNKHLQALVDPKELEVLRQLGGLKGLCKGLQTDAQAGLSWDETTVPVKVTLAEAQAAANLKDGEKSESAPFVAPPQITKKTTLGLRRNLTARSTMKAGDDKMTDRKATYGTNVLPARKTKNIFQLMWIALQDKVLIILSVAAVVSLALGLYETFSGPAEIDPLTGRPTPHIEWVEGVAIIVAIAIVTIVGSANDYQKERQFAKLNKKVGVVKYVFVINIANS